MNKRMVVIRRFKDGDVSQNSFAFDELAQYSEEYQYKPMDLVGLVYHRPDGIDSLKVIPIPEGGSLELYVE